jgi:hypothetical protein
MVSLGNVFNDKNVTPTVMNQGGTFMHELGHNLGLRHGGGSDLNGDAEDTPTFKPNYLSVMNYKFQLVGIQRANAIGSIAPQRCSSDGDCGPGEHCNRTVFTYKFQCTPHYVDGPTRAAPLQLASLAQDELTHEMASRAHALYPPRTAQIVIRPECSDTRKPVAPGQPGTLRVALLGSDDLDVTEVEPSSLSLHGAKASRTSIRDVNGDGKPDMVVELDMSAVRLHRDARTGTLRGWMKDSQAFSGSDQVVILPSMAAVHSSCR